MFTSLFDHNVTFTLLNNTMLSLILTIICKRGLAVTLFIYSSYVFLSTLIGLLHILKPMLGFCLYYPMEKCQCAASL